MIVSDIIKIKNKGNVSTEYVESELNKKQISPLRWAIVDVDKENLTISLAYERE